MIYSFLSSVLLMTFLSSRLHSEYAAFVFSFVSEWV